MTGQKTELPVFYGLEHYLKKNAAVTGKNRSVGDNRKRKSPQTPLNLIEPPIADYTVIDLETGGLECTSAPIIEIGAVKVRNRQAVGSLHRLIRINSQLDSTIINLTGITDELLQS